MRKPPVWKPKQKSSLYHEKGNGRRDALALLTLTLALAAPATWAQQTPDAPTSKPADAPQAAPQTAPQDAPASDGSLALPTGPPPTGLQAPVPPPAAPLTIADKPLQNSPSLTDLAAYLKARPLTINDAVAITLATNRSLASANAALLLAQGRTSEARAALNPTLGVAYQFLALSQASTANVGGRNITTANQFQNTFTPTATLPIDISGLLRAATDQARFQEVAARLDVNRTRNQVVSDVKSSFYTVLRSQALVAVAQDNLQNTEAQLQDALAKFQAGTVARFDVLTAQTAALTAQQQIIQAQNTLSNNIASLNNTIGLNINTPIQITAAGAVENPPGVEPPADTPPPVPPPSPNAPNVATEPSRTDKIPDIVTDPIKLGPEYDAALREALATRPEILEGDANIAAAQRGILIARRSLLPSLTLGLGVNYTPDAAGFSPQTSLGTATVSVSLPLFDGGISRARVTQARANIATQEVNRRASVDQVTLDTRQAYLNLTLFRNSVAVANAALTQAREAYRLARVRYTAGVAGQVGVSPQVEVSNAQTALTQAESNQVNALYDYNNARATLDRAIGRYSYVPVGPGYTAPPPPKTTGTPTNNPEGDRR